MTSRIVNALVVAVCTLAIASPALAQGIQPAPPPPNGHILPGQWALDGLPRIFGCRSEILAQASTPASM